ncbi:MAG: hypothetical protein DMG93_21100 [Acidobacteria bacterium]|nr:MAG: hypothetical protein DMG93_21100 [Acidobacteriota bacterium]
MKYPPLTSLLSIFFLLFSFQFRSEAMASGGGGKGGGHNIAVTISPTSSQLSTGQSQQFTANISGTRYKSIVWMVNGVAGGNTTVGTVSSSGLYTAPATAPDNSVQVTAASVYQPSASASAIVSISSGVPVAISVTPSSTSLQLGATKQFAASVSGTSNTAVAWLVNGATGGSAALGTISIGGLYTAPSNMPSAAIAVTAQSVAQPTATASASVQLTSPSVAVFISPGSASVMEGKTQQFSAQVSGSANTSVDWIVSGIPGGNSSVGTVTSSGLYTAPMILPSSQVLVTAQSSASPQTSATALVTVFAPVAHSVALSWNSSTSSVAGYNIYRGTQSTGPFTKLNSLVNTATVYTDSNVASGTTYYYTATSIDSNGAESQYSNIAQALVP